VVQEGFQLAAQTGVHVVDHQLCVAGVHGSLFAGDLAGAGDYLRRFGEGLRPGAFFDVAHYHHVATWLALAKGDFAAARTHCETAVEYATLCGADHAIAVARLTLAHLQAETGDHAAALSNLADVLCWTTKADSKNMRFHSFLSRAHVLLNMKDEAGALAALREGLAVGRAEGYVAHAWWIGFCRDVMARLCAKALEAGIETTYVQTLVRRLRLAPERPPWHVDTWPWPIRVHTLGHFAVLKDGAPLHFAGKAQKKPLELLRALIALDGQGVNTAELAEILWPDADGDMAAHACETTLYRLRKLLGEDGCLTLHDGLLSLNPAYCWLDVWAFEQALERAEIQRALSLYRGPFLGRDGAPWALPLRDRLRSKFLRAVLQQGKALAESNQWEATIEGYLKGLETDPLAEELYRHLMLAYRKLDRFAEALAVYRRCQTALTSLLGAEPAPQTQALWREIRTAWQ
jgi:DNA-binding SARP family transcriptional activator